MRRLIAWSIAAAVVALTGIMGLYQLRRGSVLDPATISTIHDGTGWHAVETMAPDGTRFHWTDGDARVELPSPGIGLRRWHAILANPAGVPTNAQWCLGIQCAALSVPSQPRQFTMFVGRSGDTALRLTSPSIQEPAGTRQLGIAVSGQRWQTIGAATPPPLTAILSGSAAALLTAGLIRLGERSGFAFGIGIGVVLTLLLWQHFGLWRYRLLEPLLGLIISGSLTAMFLERWHRTTLQAPPKPVWQRADWLGLSVLIGIWLLTRLPLLTLPDRVGDLELFGRWATAAARDGIGAPYETGSDNMPGNLYVLWLSGSLAEQFGIAFGEPPLRFGAALLLKGPALVAEIGVAMLIWRWARAQLTHRHALIWPIIYLLTPPIWINAGWWGQTDSLVIAAFIGSMWLLERHHGRWSWILLAVALLLKMQALIVGPLLALLTVRRWGGRQLLLNGLLGGFIFAAGLAPMVIAGASDNIHAAIFQASQRWPYPTAGAYNAWYILTAGLGNLEPGGAPTLIFDTDQWLGGLSYRQAGMVFLACGLMATGWAAYRAEKGNRWLGLSIAALMFFVVPTQIHERFMSFAFAPLLLAAIANRQLMAGYAALAIANTINLFRNLNFIPWLYTALANPIWAWISSSITVLTLAWLLWRLILKKQAPHSTQPITEAS